jgi:parallel beta-helix repeat protein
MKRQGFHKPHSKTFRLLSSSHPRYTLPLRAGLSALILVSAGSMLLPAQVNAGATFKESIAPTVTAQVPATAAATAIYVNPATGADNAVSNSEATPYKTITFALSKAQPGTVIQLAGGTYNIENGEKFPLFVTQGVTLRGDDASKGQAILITGGDFFVSPTFARQNITIRAEKDSTITGITVTNPNQRGSGVWVESTNPNITNSTFVNSVREGIFVTGTGNPKIENNVFTENKGNGVSVAKSATGEIRNNLFQSTGFGIAVSDLATPLITDNQIIQNYGGVVLTGSAKPVLRNNVIQDNRDHGLVALQKAQPDLGTQENPGKNLIRNNGKKDPKKFFDVLNATAENTIVAVGNDIDPNRISGKVDFVAAKVEPSAGSGQTAFKDVPGGYWAKGYIEALASQNIIAGFPDGSFRPNEPVTRAQFATIINKALSPASKRPGIDFKDLKSNFWAYAAIQSAYQGQYVSGYPDGTFKPQQQIPRVQVLVSLANGLGLNAGTQNALSFYTDAAQIPKYATDSVAAATSRLLVINYPNVKQLNPNREATRAEVAAFVYQALVNAGRAQAIPSPYLVQTP